MNDGEELFDGVAVSPYERGQSFCMSAACYMRMAQCAMRAAEFGHVEPVLIRRLHGGSGRLGGITAGIAGCELLLYGSCNVYTLRVDASSSPARLMLCFLPLDSTLSEPGCELLRGFDEYRTWHVIASTMISREGVAGSEELLEWAEICEELSAANDWEEA